MARRNAKRRAPSARKPDVPDAQWLQRLHSHGLLRGSFRPPDVVLALRAYLRLRLMLISFASSHIQHMQKAMEQNWREKSDRWPVTGGQ